VIPRIGGVRVSHPMAAPHSPVGKPIGHLLFHGFLPASVKPRPAATRIRFWFEKSAMPTTAFALAQGTRPTSDGAWAPRPLIVKVAESTNGKGGLLLKPKRPLNP